MLSRLRVALVHDWLTGMRGGEKVLEVFADLFPDAPIYTLLHTPGSVSASLESHPIITSPLQRLPRSSTHYRYYLPLMPWLAEQLRIEPVDLVLGTSACVAKGVRPPAGAKSAFYIHSPMRYIYDRYNDYFSATRAGLATRAAMRLARPYLRWWDHQSTSRVDSMVGNSHFVAQRIERIYNRHCSVIAPPVDVDRFRNNERPGDYYLMVTALVPYKNVDLAIGAFRGLDRKLLIAGSGPMLKQLQSQAPPNVEMLGWVSDDRLPSLVAGCRAFLMPNVEDFGIAPVEAMAAGRPVIALGEGGIRDTVRDLDRCQTRSFESASKPSIRHDRPTGLFFYEPSAEALTHAIHRFESNQDAFDSGAIAAWAKEFHIDRFRQRIVSWLEEVMGDRKAQAA